MEPLTGLGAAAAASQLLVQGVKIAKFLAELYGRCQEPDFIRKQIVQVEQLVEIARLIEDNPSLQKKAYIASILESCGATAAKLLEILEKVAVKGEDGKVRKVQKAILSLLKEKETLHFFNDLEREKSSLILCIQEIDS